ncbi:MAG: hypothetical protein H0V78_05190 [Burkholderiales bacterium]|nr:hypothetical protein [Burkholderiales bacterium]
MNKFLSRMLAVLFTAGLSFTAAAEESHPGASDKGKSDYGSQRGVTDDSSNRTRAEVQAEYKAAVANCNNQSGAAKTSCMKKAAKERDKMMSSVKTRTKGEAGVSGRTGTGAGTNNNDSAPVGEKSSDPTSQGSSATKRATDKAGSGSSSRSDKEGVSGRAGTGAGTNNNDSAPVGEKSSDPTSQGSSATKRTNDKPGSGAGSGSSSRTDKEGVSGRAGKGAGTDNDDSALIGEKPSNPTSQGSSALDRETEGSGSKRK